MTEQFQHEWRTLIRSPATWLLLLLFTMVNGFLVFWVERFFARNLADLRPLFSWLPYTVMAFSAALSMRSWSEERRSGTLDLLLAAPLSGAQLVQAKYLAGVGVLLFALLLTLPLPVSVAMMGELDVGITFAGYCALFLLGMAALAVGYFASLLSENPIVSLLIAVFLLFLLTIPGNHFVTEPLGHEVVASLAYFGMTSRADLVTRGLFDLGTLFYFSILAGLFLTLAVLQLQRLRTLPGSVIVPSLRLVVVLVVALLLLVAAASLSDRGIGRHDMSDQQRFTLSEATRTMLSELERPVTIHAFISEQTHPLLGTLIPELRDLLTQYDFVGGEQLLVNVADPRHDIETETLAVERFGIRPTTFQSADRYQTSVVSSYFDLVIEDGVHFETINYRDLIEMKMVDETRLEVQLRNPEYDLTRAIQRAVSAAQEQGELFSRINSTIQFNGYISGPNQLPQALAEIRQTLADQLVELEKDADGKFSYQFIDPLAGDGSTAALILEEYGFRPQVLDPLDEESFYFYMLLDDGTRQVPISLPRDLDPEALRRHLQTGIKRFQPGSLKRIGLHAPEAPLLLPGVRQSGIPAYKQLEERLRDNADVIKLDLSSGKVPDGLDMVIVIDPHQLDEKQLFALDQYLLRGGDLLVSLSPWRFNLDSKGISAQRHMTGLEEWLGFHGVHIEPMLVMDNQNMAFPVPVKRQVGEVTFDQLEMLPYPYFIDIRSDGMQHGSDILGQLDQLTLNWPSPLSLQPQESVTTTVLLQSSESSGMDDTVTIQPDFSTWPATGFPVVDQDGPQTLAAALQGGFYSWFSGRVSAPAGIETHGELLTRSMEDGRLIVIAAGPFLSDEAITLATEVFGTSYLNSLLFVDQVVNWSTEQPGLQALRGQGRLASMLIPMSDEQRRYWEWFNYGAGLLLLVLGLGFFLIAGRVRRARQDQQVRNCLSQ